MAKQKLVWVRAKARGQIADRTWRDVGDPPFQVLESAVSKTWMVRLTEAEVEALGSVADPEPEVANSDEAVQGLKDQIAKLNEQVTAADTLAASSKQNVDTLTAANDQLKADLAEAEAAKTDAAQALADKDAAISDLKKQLADAKKPAAKEPDKPADKGK